MIDIKSLNFSYDADFVLNISELVFNDNGFISLIGPNGSGKTTLLRILAGLLTGYKGTVLYDGENIADMSREKIAAKVSYVPVYARPDNPVSVESFILSGAYRYGGEADIREVTELCGIGHIVGKSVYEISSGEQKRTLIARALLQKTDVIIMDEPFANLDPYFEIRIMDLVREISKNKLIISSVHNITVSSVISDKTAGMKDGRLEFFSNNNPDELMLENLYSAGFISIDGYIYPDYSPK